MTYRPVSNHWTQQNWEQCRFTFVCGSHFLNDSTIHSPFTSKFDLNHQTPDLLALTIKENKAELSNDIYETLIITVVPLDPRVQGQLCSSLCFFFIMLPSASIGSASLLQFFLTNVISKCAAWSRLVCYYFYPKYPTFPFKRIGRPDKKETPFTKTSVLCFFFSTRGRLPYDYLKIQFN